MDDHNILDGWYRYAARAKGFIGETLARQREQTHTTVEQQRASLGIISPQYDHFWLHLQGMRLPSKETWEDDLKRIVIYLLEREGITERLISVEKLNSMLDK